MITVPMQVAASRAAVPMTIGATTVTVPVTLGASYASADVDPYTGTYEVTPNEETQTLSTRRKYLVEDVIVHPIPSNYGRISVAHNVITVY